jgi:hypothetical protein
MMTFLSSACMTFVTWQMFIPITDLQKTLTLKIIKEMLECSAFTCSLLPSEELNDVQQITHGEKVLVHVYT